MTDDFNPANGEVDPVSSVPRYLQVAAVIKYRIIVGDLAVGDHVPSQTSLMQRHGIARMTAHRALQSLVKDGLVVIVPGVGAVVKRKPPEQLT